MSPNNPVPLYQQIVDQVKARILSGDLRPGDPLPSIRQLAEDLLASVITTRRAYSELEAEGLIITRTGLGTFVADIPDHVRAYLKAGVVSRHLKEGIRIGRELGLSDRDLGNMFEELLKGRPSHD